jgi:hypothetical protein
MNSSSVVQIGGYDTTYMRDPTELIFVPALLDLPYWLTNVSAFRIGANLTFADG